VVEVRQELGCLGGVLGPVHQDVGNRSTQGSAVVGPRISGERAVQIGRVQVSKKGTRLSLQRRPASGHTSDILRAEASVAPVCFPACEPVAFGRDDVRKRVAQAKGIGPCHFSGEFGRHFESAGEQPLHRPCVVVVELAQRGRVHVGIVGARRR